MLVADLAALSSGIRGNQHAAIRVATRLPAAQLSVRAVRRTNHAPSGDRAYHELSVSHDRRKLPRLIRRAQSRRPLRSASGGAKSWSGPRGTPRQPSRVITIRLHACEGHISACHASAGWSRTSGSSALGRNTEIRLGRSTSGPNRIRNLLTGLIGETGDIIGGVEVRPTGTPEVDRNAMRQGVTTVC
jgi:hypothetical protein